MRRSGHPVSNWVLRLLGLAVTGILKATYGLHAVRPLHFLHADDLAQLRRLDKNQSKTCCRQRLGPTRQAPVENLLPTAPVQRPCLVLLYGRLTLACLISCNCGCKTSMSKSTYSDVRARQLQTQSVSDFLQLWMQNKHV